MKREDTLQRLRLTGSPDALRELTSEAVQERLRRKRCRDTSANCGKRCQDPFSEHD